MKQTDYDAIRRHLYLDWNRTLTCIHCGASGRAIGGWMDCHIEHLTMPCGRTITFKGHRMHRSRCDTCRATTALPTPGCDMKPLAESDETWSVWP